MYVTSIWCGCRIVVPGSSGRGGGFSGRGPGSVRRGVGLVEPGGTSEGSGYPDRRIVLHGRSNCLPVPTVLVVRCVYAGHRPFRGVRSLTSAIGRHPARLDRGVAEGYYGVIGGRRLALNGGTRPASARDRSARTARCSTPHRTPVEPRPTTAPGTHDPSLPGAHGPVHDETGSRREVAGQRGPGAGEGPWYHAAEPPGQTGRGRHDGGCRTGSVSRTRARRYRQESSGPGLLRRNSSGESLAWQRAITA